VGEAICRVGGSDGDFSLDCTPLPPPPSDGERRRSAAVEQSRSTYALPREKIEQRDSMVRDETVTAEVVPKRPRSKAVEVRASVTAEEEPPAVAPQTEPEVIVEPPRIPPRTPGRGGARHKAVQQAIKQYANALGLRATVEAPLDTNEGSVDVLVEGRSLRIAIEVADSSPLGQEVRNIEKALEAGIDCVLVVSDTPEHLAEIDKEASARGILPDQRVTFLPSGSLGDYFDSLGATLASYETKSRGYRVKVRQTALSPEEREERLAAIHRAIAEHQRDSGHEQRPEGA